MSQDEYDKQHRVAGVVASEALKVTASALDLPDASTRVLEGDAGQSICAYADEIDASAIVAGSRGRSGLKRAVLGSVSDYIVRNAPCPVIVTPPTGLDG